MNEKQFFRMREGMGFIAAMDQSGGSTPDALEHYGIHRDAYSDNQQMFDLVHRMRTRVMTCPAFTSAKILGAILFEQTIDREVEGLPTADYLWIYKGIVPFLKIDQGLAPLSEGVQLMKPMDGLDDLLRRASNRHIFGTKMRSVIKHANPDGVHKLVAQQFEYAAHISQAGLIPIVEPEVDICSSDKAESEDLLKVELQNHLHQLPANQHYILKLSIPTVDNFYEDLMADPHVVRIVALSGGYTRDEADKLLTRNHGLIASFSRALMEGLYAQLNDDTFNAVLADSIDKIYQASIT